MFSLKGVNDGRRGKFNKEVERIGWMGCPSRNSVESSVASLTCCEVTELGGGRVEAITVERLVGDRIYSIVSLGNMEPANVTMDQDQAGITVF